MATWLGRQEASGAEVVLLLLLHQRLSDGAHLLLGLALVLHAELLQKHLHREVRGGTVGASKNAARHRARHPVHLRLSCCLTLLTKLSKPCRQMLKEEHQVVQLSFIEGVVGDEPVKAKDIHVLIQAEVHVSQ